MQEFEYKGQSYKASKLDARSQFHIARRLAPVFAELSGVMDSDTQSVVASVASAIAELKDDDADYVIFGLLKAVQRKAQQGLGWAQVTANNVIMFDDIDMATMLYLVWQALMVNFQDFFAALPSEFKGAIQKQSGR